MACASVQRSRLTRSWPTTTHAVTANPFSAYHW